MADPATGRRYYHSKEPATPIPPPVPSHRSQLSRAAALQNEPQHITPGRYDDHTQLFLQLKT